MYRKNLALAALVASSALALSACGTDPYEAIAADEAPATTAPAEDTAQDAAGGAETAGEDAGDVEAESMLDDGASPLLAFGETAVYDDGLEVTADVVAETTLSDVASADVCSYGDPVTVVELTVVNGTDARLMPWEDFMGSLNAEYVDDTGYAVAASSVFDSADYNGGYELSGGQNFATLRPGQTGSDVYGFCTVDMEDGSLYLSIDATTYEEDGYKDLAEWTEDGEW